MDLATKFELHYYFGDGSHSMDAHIRNKCEYELLAIFGEIADRLGIDIEIVSEVYGEGGLKNFWGFCGKNGSQITLILAVVTIILSRIPLPESELDELKKEETTLSIQEKRLNIKKLEQELGVFYPNEDAINSAVDIASGSLKITTRKSNFYKNLNNCHKVTKVGFSRLSENYQVVGEEKVINRNEFNKFILNSHDLKPIFISDAEIEIISPVLKEGNYKWKGAYQGEIINFSMIDKDFKKDVLSEKVTFQHGSSIECVLKINQKLDEIGDIVITGYSVETVISKTDGQSKFETPQGKRYKFNKKQIEGQGDLFDEAKPSGQVPHES